MTPAHLDRFIPNPDVRERFEATVDASASLVLQVATNFDMQSLPAVKMIFRLREVMLGTKPAAVRAAQGILAETKGLG